MKIKISILAILFVSFSPKMDATDSLQVVPEMTDEEYERAIAYFLDSLESTLVYQTEKVSLGDGIANINVPAGFKYLNGKDGDMILTDIWGNPPVEDGMHSLGMLLPEAQSALDDSVYVINITYSEDGYIDDSDAKEIDYEELLETMQDDLVAENEYRIQNGYEEVALVGWASPPFYDAENKKLHWAKELKFGSMESNTLNYNIRVLGRKGYLNLNAIGEMYSLEEIKGNINPILASVNFVEGNKYSDFDPSLDKVAAVGIGGLIAGKVLMKAGILAKIGLVLAKFWKFILIGFVAFGAGIKKLFVKGDATEA